MIRENDELKKGLKFAATLCFSCYNKSILKKNLNTGRTANLLTGKEKEQT